MVKSGTGREGGAVSVPAAVLFRRGKEAWNGASRDGRPPERGKDRMRENKGFVDRKGFV